MVSPTQCPPFSTAFPAQPLLPPLIFSRVLILYLSSGSSGMHQRHQPQADVPAVPGFT